MAPLCFQRLKGNHWLGMSQSQTPLQSHTSLTQWSTPGAAAHQAAQHKIAKYSKLASTHMFYPIAGRRAVADEAPGSLGLGGPCKKFYVVTTSSGRHALVPTTSYSDVVTT